MSLQVDLSLLDFVLYTSVLGTMGHLTSIMTSPVSPSGDAPSVLDSSSHSPDGSNSHIAGCFVCLDRSGFMGDPLVKCSGTGDAAHVVDRLQE